MHALLAQHPVTLATANAAGIASVAVVGALVLAALVFFLGALFSIVTSPLGAGMKLVWVVVALAAPFLGSLAWFAIGRRDAHRRLGAA